MDPFIGQIMMFGGNFAPRNWAMCEGPLLAISNYQALFSILGTTYGGDGVTTFALPDFRGRFPMHWGTGPGLTPRHLGERDGVEDVALTINQTPAHSHTVKCKSSQGSQGTPVGNLLAADRMSEEQFEGNGTAQMNPAMIDMTGGGQPHDNMPPFQAVSFVIALAGVFPSS